MRRAVRELANATTGAAVALLIAFTGLGAISIGLGRSTPLPRTPSLSEILQTTESLFYAAQRVPLELSGHNAVSFSPLGALFVVGAGISLGGYLCARLGRRSGISWPRAGVGAGVAFGVAAALLATVSNPQLSTGVRLAQPFEVSPLLALAISTGWGISFALCGAWYAQRPRHEQGEATRTPSPNHAVYRAALVGTAEVTRRAAQILLALMVLTLVCAAFGFTPLPSASNPSRFLAELAAIAAIAPNLLISAVFSALGAPVHWSGTFIVSAKGSQQLTSPYSAAVVAILLLVAVRGGFVAARALDGAPSRRLAAAVFSALPLCLVIWLAGLLVAGSAPLDGSVGFSLRIAAGSTLFFPLALLATGAALGGALQLVRSDSVNRTVAPRIAFAVALAASLLLPVTGAIGGGPPHRSFGPAVAFPDRAVVPDPNSHGVTPRVIGISGSEKLGSQRAVRAGLSRLRSDSTAKVTAVRSPVSHAPSFISADVPVGAHDSAVGEARAVARRYAGAFGLRSLRDLRLDRKRSLPPGTGFGRAIQFEQVHRGVPVEGGLTIHFGRSGRDVVAITNSLMPDVGNLNVTPHVSATDALSALRKHNPNLRTLDDARLRIALVPDEHLQTLEPALVWITTVTGVGPEPYEYLLDAQTGRLRFAVPAASDASRLVYPFNNEAASANWSLVAGMQNGVPLRTEGSAALPSGGPYIGSSPFGAYLNNDANNAYDFLGQAYDFYSGTYGWNSYDGLGSPQVANVGANWDVFEVPEFGNAAWLFFPVGAEGMVISPGFVTRDVVGHEFSHGVLGARAQNTILSESGFQETEAIHEAFADIMATYIDNTSDWWLIGEGLPAWVRGDGTKRALRNVSDPADPTVIQQGDTNVSQFSACTDGHVGAGIVEKAYYQIQSSLGRSDAGRIFFDAAARLAGPDLRVGFSDLRAATVAAADQLLGASAVTAVESGWDSVGVTSGYGEPNGFCVFGIPVPVPCAVVTALTTDQPTDSATLDTWHRVEDQLLPNGYDTAIKDQHPLAYWRLGENSNTFLDSSGNNHSLTASGNATYGLIHYFGALVSGIDDDGVLLNTDEFGNANQYDASLSSTYNPFQNGTTRTFEGWARRDSATALDMLFGGGATHQSGPYLTLGGQFGLPVNSVLWAPAGNTGAKVQWDNAWPGTKKWVHWALVYNQSAGTAELFIDGKSQGTRAISSPYAASPGNFRLGAWGFNGANYYQFNGRMDEVAIYDKAIPQPVLEDHFHQGKYTAQAGGESPLLYWRLGETSGTTAADDSGNQQPGTYVGSPTLHVDGGFANSDDNGAVDLNGTSQYISSAYSGAFANGTTRTFEGWAKRRTENTLDMLFGGSSSDQSAPYLTLGGEFGSSPSSVFWAPAGNTGAKAQWDNAWPGTAQWVHWALIFNEAGDTAELFINGKSQGVKTLTTPYPATAGTFNVGTWRALGGAYYDFDGQVDEVAVYPRALTPSEIQAHVAVAEESAAGPEIQRVYSQDSTAISQLLLDDANLRNEARGVLETLGSGLSAVMAGGAGPQMSTTDQQQAYTFMNDLENAAYAHGNEPGMLTLYWDVVGALSDVAPLDYAGKSYREAWRTFSKRVCDAAETPCKTGWYGGY